MAENGSIIREDALLEVKRLKKFFPIHRGWLRREVGQIRAVDDVSFFVRPGETLSLVGESGCGKTTTARCVLRAVDPTAGEVLFKASDGSVVDIASVNRASLRPLRREMQMIFQDPFSSLNSRMTLQEIVDTDGNQLPYIDKMSLTLAESLEIANLRAMAGELDLQTRHMDLQKLPVFLENRDKGNYAIRLDPQAEAAQTSLQFNMSYVADPEIAKWLNNKDFRRALSMGIDRAQINEAFFLGTGTPGSVAPDDTAPDSPGPEWRSKWSTLDVKQANDLLDRIGLDKKDSEGYRLRTDGSDRLRLEITTVAAAFLPWAQQMEMVAQHWKKIGIQADIKDTERNLAVTKNLNNETQIYIWGAGTEDLFLFPRHELPVEPIEPFTGPLYAKWFASNGEQGTKPTDPDLLKAMDLLRSGAGVEEGPRMEIGKQIRQLIVDNQWVIGTVGFVPNVRVISNKMGNVPERISWRSRCRTPGATHPSTYYFKS